MNREHGAAWMDRFLHFGFYALFFAIPLILTPWNYELFEFNKMMLTYGLTTWIVSAWCIKMILVGSIKITRTPLDIPILLFILSQFISSIFSIDTHVSWFGYYSRFNGGMFSVVSYVLLYYAFVSNWKPSQQISGLLKFALLSGTIVSIYAILERLGIDKHLWVQDVQNRVFSTLGQPNWLAAFIIALTPISIALTLGNTHPHDKLPKSLFRLGLIWILIGIVFFLVLLFTKSRSGFLGFIIADFVFWGFVIVRTARNALLMNTRKTLITYFLFWHIALSIVIFFVGSPIEQINKFFTLEAWKMRLSPTSISTTPPTSSPVTAQLTPAPAPLLEVGGTESGEIRKYVWQGAIAAWQSSTKTQIIGTGTETFAFAFFRFRPIGHNMTSEWDFLYNKAHNEYLNYLATTGVFGLGSYLLFIATFVIWWIKAHGLSFLIHKKSQALAENNEQLMMNLGLFAGWVSILVTNFFGFSVVIIQLFFFLFPAMLVVSNQHANGNHASTWFSFTLPKRLPRFTWLVPVVIMFFILFTLARIWWADVLFNQGYRKNRQENYIASQAYLDAAIQLNPNEPLYHDEFSTALSGLGISAFETKESSKAAEFIKDSIKHSDLALSISPQNVNMWKTRTKLFYMFASVDPRFNELATTALEQAKSLSPNDPKILYNLAILYGRNGDNDKAIETLQQAKTIKPNYRDAYYALWVFYTEEKKADVAKQILEEYLAKVDPNDKDFLGRLNE